MIDEPLLDEPAAGVVQLRSLVVGGLPLLVASAERAGRSERLVAHLREAGLTSLSTFIGADLPRGARVGLVVAADELRLVDERDETLLRAPRSGLDRDWLRTAQRLRGTMLVLARDVDLQPEWTPGDLAALLDGAAREGCLMGAIVGVAEERPTLPLVL